MDEPDSKDFNPVGEITPTSDDLPIKVPDDNRVPPPRCPDESFEQYQERMMMWKAWAKAHNFLCSQGVFCYCPLHRNAYACDHPDHV